MTGAVLASAPGRVNLIGEHTDYSGGFVLPVALPHRTHVELVRRADRLVRVRSEALGVAGYTLGEERPVGGWIDAVQGCTAVLRGSGHDLGGFDLSVRSRVPIGAGLASSAALAIALLRVLRSAFSLPLGDVELALVAQRADHEFVGVRSGIMDQLVASLGREGVPLFIDTDDLRVEAVPLPAGAELVVIHSGTTHHNASGAYNTRRAECEEAARLLGVGNLRAVMRPPSGLPAPLDRRARHVVSENARVLETVAALRAGDLEQVGAQLDASHASLRDDYEVSSAALDLLVEIATAQPEITGARLTGAGLGGSIVALAPAGDRGAAARIAAAYATRSANVPSVVLPA